MRTIIPFKKIFTFSILILLYRCNTIESNPAGAGYYSTLRKALKKEYNISSSGEENVLIFILHSDTICSCNGKNIYLVNEIINKRKNYKPIIVLKNDFSNSIRNLIRVEQASFYSDTTKLLEKNGSLFQFDKIFVVHKGEYANMFDLEDKDVKTIKKYFKL